MVVLTCPPDIPRTLPPLERMCREWERIESYSRVAHPELYPDTSITGCGRISFKSPATATDGKAAVPGE